MALLPIHKKDKKDSIILYRQFKRDITLPDVLMFYDYLLQYPEILEGKKAIIDDYRNVSSIEFDMKDLQKAKAFFDKKDTSVLKGLKVALIVDSPKVAYAQMYKSYTRNAIMECFSTMEYAFQWAMEGINIREFNNFSSHHLQDLADERIYA